MTPLHATILINEADQLARFAEYAGRHSQVAVDLEADSMYHFREKVCLLQMCAGNQIAIIDPLVLDDLSPLKPLFADESVCKVFHGADYDVRSLYRDFNITINNLFDTQLAATFLGMPETSLDALVKAHFKIELDKKYQKKDWSQRPLPQAMLEYAAADVSFLIPLAASLRKKLVQKGRLEWVTEECQYLVQARPADNNGQPLFVKCKGAGRLSPRQLAILEALLQWRMQRAKSKDRPLFKVISNNALLKLALAMPTSQNSLKATGILSPKQIQMYGRALTDAIARARQLPPEKLPLYPRNHSPRLPVQLAPKIKALRNWRDSRAASEGLDPPLLLSKSLIRQIVLANPSSVKELAKVDGIRRWQCRILGPELIEILSRTPNARIRKKRRKRRQRRISGKTEKRST